MMRRKFLAVLFCIAGVLLYELDGCLSVIVQGRVELRYSGYGDLESGDSEEPSGSVSGESEEPSGPDSGDSKEPSESGSGDSEKPSGSGSGDSEKPSGSGSGDSEKPSGSGSGDSKKPSGSGSGEMEEKHPFEWVKHTREGDTIFVSGLDVESISQFVRNSEMNNSTCFASEGSKADFGSFGKRQHGSTRNEHFTSRTSYTYNCRKPVDNTFQYPEYAVGFLDNSCTAFLIGPFHAMTSASCVYNNQQSIWEEMLDFWRGRHTIGSRQRMKWSTVFIPRSYFDGESISNSWAIINFKYGKPSPIWLSLGFCEGEYFGPTKGVSGYGYLPQSNKIMYQSKCFAGETHLNCWCSQESCAPNFNGGPIVSKCESTPQQKAIVFGLSFDHVGRNNSPCSTRKQMALSIDSDMFWSVCYLLKMQGFNANCQKLSDDLPEKEVRTFHQIVQAKLERLFANIRNMVNQYMFFN